MRKRNYIRKSRIPRGKSSKGMAFLAGAAFALYLLVTFIFGEMGLVKYYRMRSQYLALREETEELKLENARLLKDVRALRSDPALIERIARDKLGLARPGEIVYYYQQIRSGPESRDSQ